MIYNSFLYVILFPFLFLLSYAVKGSNIKKYLLLAVSYLLYAYYNQSLVVVLFFVTLLSYAVARILNRKGNMKEEMECKERLANHRKAILTGGVIAIVAPLLFYKYTDFILTQILHLPSLSANHLWVVPLGISFFTFQSLSYIFDVSRGKYEAERDFSNYMLFVSFFPSIVAGPINRYDALKPQIERLDRPDYQKISNGIKMIVWGMFLKTVIADRLVLYINPIFDEYQAHSGSELLSASVLYSIQLYTDFAGYSLLAIGSAALLGIRLQKNFHNPYFSTSVTDFWHRWHISLSQWLRDYIYIPLGGSRCSKHRTYLNILITFLISGIWHGANWTFILWGMLHGVFQVIEKIVGRRGKREENKFGVKWKSQLECQTFIGKARRYLVQGLHIFLTFVLITFLWIIFRMPSIGDAMAVIGKIFTSQDFNFWVFEKFILLFILMAFVKDFIDEVKPASNPFHYRKAWVRWTTYIIVTTSIFLFGVFDAGQFIYAGF